MPQALTFPHLSWFSSHWNSRTVCDATVLGASQSLGHLSESQFQTDRGEPILMVIIFFRDFEKCSATLDVKNVL